jgi:hypothetical protein
MNLMYIFYFSCGFAVGGLVVAIAINIAARYVMMKNL